MNLDQRSPWISVGALARGFAPDSNTLPPNDALVGASVVLHLEDGSGVRYDFESDGDDILAVVDGKVRLPCRITSLRDGLYFIDYMQDAADGQSITVLLDRKRQICLVVRGRLPTKQETQRSMFDRVLAGDELTAVTATFLRGAVDHPYNSSSATIEETDELVDSRIRYRYSRTELYEHIYLNRNFYVWQCLAGVEKGLADTDRCHYFKLGESLYLLVWREKVVPTLGVVTIDLQRNKTDGKICGYESNDFGSLTNFPIGARAEFVSKTTQESVP